MNQTLMPEQQLLADQLLERTLEKLGFCHQPDPTFETLRAFYGIWCQNVPFDNLRKLIHVRGNKPGPLPGHTPSDFLEGWLNYGTGGTCWSGAGAFHAVLAELGFNAVRAIGTMLVTPDLPPNHGTVVVNFDGQKYLVDCGILHGEPLALRHDSETGVAHGAWGVKCYTRDGRWYVRWRPLNRLDGFECRLDRFGSSLQEFQELHTRTRGWSPFNYQANARINVGNRVVGVAYGYGVTIESDGSVTQQALSTEERNRLLIEQVGINENLVALLPADVPTPPPPGSRTALRIS